MEGLIFGGAYLRREICVSQSIGLALQLEVNLLFFLCFTLPVWGLIFGGAYKWRGLFSELYGIASETRYYKINILIDCKEKQIRLHKIIKHTIKTVFRSKWCDLHFHRTSGYGYIPKDAVNLKELQEEP